VVVAIEQNISRNGKKQKRFWRGLLFGSSVLSAIIAMWGIILSINITHIPIWQYMGFTTSILNAFITYKMTKSILVTTRETQESTNHVRQSITPKEYEKQLYALFNMKQMIAALIFIGLYAIYSFSVNLYFIINAKIILMPFQTSIKWYFYSNVAIFNLYIYSLIFIIFFYSWLSHKTMKDFAMLSKRKSTVTTPDCGENDIVILPDMMEMEYPSHINPNHLNNIFHVPSDSEHNVYNNSRRSSYNPEHSMQHSIQHKLQMHVNSDALSYGSSKHISGISDMTMPDAFASTKCASDDSQIDIFPIFNMKLSVRHRARSSMADEINVDGFIQESKKNQPHTTMFDVPICAMKKSGCSLERIYFDSQKYRGITPNSLRLTAKMRSVSYSQNAYIDRHSRNNTKSNVSADAMLHVPSIPNVQSHSLEEDDEEYDDDDDDDEEEISQISSCYSSSHQSKSNVMKQHVQIKGLAMSKSINITVPENAVLTPDKVTHSMQIKAKSPQSINDDNVEVIKEDNVIMDLDDVDFDHSDNSEIKKMEWSININSGSTEL